MKLFINLHKDTFLVRFYNCNFEAYNPTELNKYQFMKSLFILCSISIILFSCKPTENKLSAQEIIDKSIKVTGVDKIKNATLSFDFRDRSYKAIRYNGKFALERITKTDSVDIKDVLFNDGFQRFINNLPYAVLDSMAIKYSESINSVHYFSVLPYGLNDKAVQKKLLEESTIKGAEYYKIQITFAQEGGGVDYDDVFIYWIDKKDFKIDYLAYTFHVNGGGMRFREVRKEHAIQGIILADYNNYKPKDSNIELTSLDKTFEKGELIKASEINLENIEIELINLQQN